MEEGGKHYKGRERGGQWLTTWRSLGRDRNFKEDNMAPHKNRQRLACWQSSFFFFHCVCFFGKVVQQHERHPICFFYFSTDQNNKHIKYAEGHPTMQMYFNFFQICVTLQKKQNQSIAGIFERFKSKRYILMPKKMNLSNSIMSQNDHFMK